MDECSECIGTGYEQRQTTCAHQLKYTESMPVGLFLNIEMHAHKLSGEQS